MKDTAISIGGNAFGYVLAVIQSNEVLQIISFVLSVMTSLIIIGYKVWVWWREAKKDGKITKDELQQLGDSISDDMKDLHDKTKGEGK